MNLRWQTKVLFSRIRYSLYILWRVPFLFSNWPTFLFGRFGTAKQILKLRNGLRFLIRPRESDRATVSEMFLLKPYVNRALGYVVNRGDVVVDVGANIGAFALFAAREAPEGRVFAIEPGGANCQMLRENIKLNQAPQVEVFHLALDNRDGTRELSLDGVASSFHYGNSDAPKEIVPTQTLKSFLVSNQIDHVDYLKMDCEGAEFDILFSSDRETLSKIGKFALEFHNLSAEQHVEKLKVFLAENGFRIDYCAGEWNGILLATFQAPH